jgi:hypothetical protein
MHMAPRAAAWAAWAVWTCNTPHQGIRSKESGLRSALFFWTSKVPYFGWFMPPVIVASVHEFDRGLGHF